LIAETTSSEYQKTNKKRSENKRVKNAFFVDRSERFSDVFNKCDVWTLVMGLFKGFMLSDTYRWGEIWR